MRIAYLVNQYPTVSHTFIRREIMALERRGIEVMRIALRGWNQDLVDHEDKIERERTRYVLRAGLLVLLLAVPRMLFVRPLRLLAATGLVWGMAKRSERPLAVHLAYLAEACRVLPWLHANRIQHLHAHFGTNAAEVALLIRALGGPTWSFTVHGPEEFDKASFIGLDQKIRCCAFVAAISSFGRSQLYRCVEQKFWFKVHLVHCGLESKMFALQSKSQMSTKRFVCVGRLCEQKGQLLLVDAARRLVPKWPDLELVLAGDGELRPDLEAQINTYGLQRNIRITGWISGDQVRDEILAARALVLPSFAEGLPVVIMEAMALKRPVISTFVGGIPELVRAGEDGWLVPAGDVEALTQAMQVCLDQSEIVLARMGEAANLRVLAHHSVDAEAAKLASLFQSAIEEASSA